MSTALLCPSCSRLAAHGFARIGVESRWLTAIESFDQERFKPFATLFGSHYESSEVIAGPIEAAELRLGLDELAEIVG
ncbi:MAG: hypothetical protein H0T51_14375 [Pirellulales bacterium]|nr:hypothetical protein [Pirellulales bacterium]